MLDNFFRFADIKMWDKFVVNYALPGTVKILIGNKTDLETERKIPKEEGKVRHIMGLNYASRLHVILMMQLQFMPARWNLTVYCCY